MNNLADNCRGCYVYDRIVGEERSHSDCIIMDRINNPHLKYIYNCPCWTCLVKIKCENKGCKERSKLIFVSIPVGGAE